MHVEFSYANVESSDALESHTHQQLESAIGRFEDRLTRVEVHFADENSAQKSGSDDKRCTMEARPRGRDPITVEANAGDFYPAVNDAAGKLKRALAKRLERD
ncbi:MAG: HPF/RaiA family ribosome-associated protein [Phycisphaera sp.]|nr:MAG: HPF/RaiA family ribosome-associated protein [Phycisphaera sp.]